MTGGLTPAVHRPIADSPDQQHGTVHVSHAATLSVVEESMYTAEHVCTLAAHRQHLRHEWQSLKASLLIERCVYFVPRLDLD
jgi:hypothetical protein